MIFGQQKYQRNVTFLKNKQTKMKPKWLEVSFYEK